MSRREAGWIVIQGLLYQGEEWMSQNIEQILMVFYSIFNRDMCTIAGFTSVSQILREFDLKLRALEALNLLIRMHTKLLNEANKHNVKLVSSFLNHACNFLFNNSKDKNAQEMAAIYSKASPKQFKEAKLHLIESIAAIDKPEFF